MDDLTTSEKINMAYGPVSEYVEDRGFWSTFDICALIVTVLGSFEELDETLNSQYDAYRPSKWVVEFANGDQIVDHKFSNQAEARKYATIQEDLIVTSLANLQARKILTPLRVRRETS